MTENTIGLVNSAVAPCSRPPFEMGESVSALARKPFMLSQSELARVHEWADR